MQNAPAHAAVKVKHSRSARNWLVLLMWPAQFGRKLVLGMRHKWPRPRRWQFFSRRDRDKTLVSLETGTSRLRRQPWIWFCCYRKNGEKVGKTSSGRWHGVLKRVKNLPGINAVSSRCAPFMLLCMLHPLCSVYVLMSEAIIWSVLHNIWQTLTLNLTLNPNLTYDHFSVWGPVLFTVSCCMCHDSMAQLFPDRLLSVMESCTFFCGRNDR